VYGRFTNYSEHPSKAATSKENATSGRHAKAEEIRGVVHVSATIKTMKLVLEKYSR
jgi:hypothetical protein